MVANTKPDGWHVEMLSIVPEKLIVGERNVVLGCIGVSAGLAVLGPMKFPAWWLVFVVVGIVGFIGLMAAIYRAWRADPWMSRVYDRFRKYPSFIPAHGSVASRASLRQLYRNRKHFKR